MNKIPAILICLAVLSGCTTPDVTPAKYSNVPSARIVLDVASINIIDHSGFQPSDSPYHTSRLEPTIAYAIRQWVSETFQAGGTSGQATVVIQDASLAARAIPMNNGTFDKWFTRQQASEYIGHVDVQVEAKGHTNYAFASAEAKHSASLPESSTEAEKQNAYVTLLNGLMKDLRQNLEVSVREHMHGVLLPAPATGKRVPDTLN